MNPLITALVAFAGVLDLAFLIQTLRQGTTLPLFAVGGIQLVVIVSGLGALFGGEPTSSISVWILLAAVNVCLGLAGLRRQRLLAVVGLVGTAGAILLILLHSFASLPLIAAAGIICLGTVLFPSRRAASA